MPAEPIGATGEPLARSRKDTRGPVSRAQREAEAAASPGRVVETAGRRVLVRDDEGERLCFLAGHRVVVGDGVRWTDAPGEGGKIVSVDERKTALRRVDPRGDEQVLVANLEGLLVVAAPQDPPFHAPLIDRYLVAASKEGLDAAVLLNKIDRGVPADVDAALALRERHGVRVLRASVATKEGIDDVRAFLASTAGPWALVGYSGVGKTSLVSALLPDQDVGPIGELSEYWGTGRHTTTHTRLFRIPSGGEIADSPGIRGFVPAGLTAIDVRDHFPGMEGVGCKYRDCLHRPGEDGCKAEATVDPDLLASYRRLANDVEDARRRREP